MSSETSTVHLARRSYAGRLVYASFFLLILSGGSIVGKALYYSHLVHSGEFSFLFSVSQNFAGFVPELTLLEFVGALLFFLPLSESVKAQYLGRATAGRFLRPAVVGTSVGLLAGVLSAVLILAWGEPPPVTVFLANHLYSPLGAVAAATLVLLLPVATEILFRGILLGQLLERMPLTPAALASTVLFVCVWPFYGIIGAAIFGLAVVALFNGTRNLVACISADAVYSLTVITLLMVRTLYR